MMIVLWFIFAFLMGSLPIALWLGRIFLKKDIREYGDGNPGTTNVYRASGRNPMWFAFPFALEVSKAAVPVGLAHQLFGIDGWSIVAIALAPLLGHAFSPFMGGRGGKAVAAGFGALIGLTLAYALITPIILTPLAIFVKPSGWALIITMTLTLILAVILTFPFTWTATLIGMILIFIYTHREDLRERPRLKTNGKR